MRVVACFSLCMSLAHAAEVKRNRLNAFGVRGTEFGRDESQRDLVAEILNWDQSRLLDEAMSYSMSYSYSMSMGTYPSPSPPVHDSDKGDIAGQGEDPITGSEGESEPKTEPEKKDVVPTTPTKNSDGDGSFDLPLTTACDGESFAGLHKTGLSVLLEVDTKSDETTFSNELAVAMLKAGSDAFSLCAPTSLSGRRLSQIKRLLANSSVKGLEMTSAPETLNGECTPENSSNTCHKVEVTMEVFVEDATKEDQGKQDMMDVLTSRIGAGKLFDGLSSGDIVDVRLVQEIATTPSSTGEGSNDGDSGPNATVIALSTLAGVAVVIGALIVYRQVAKKKKAAEEKAYNTSDSGDESEETSVSPTTNIAPMASIPEAEC